MKPSISLISELEEAIKSGSSEKRVATLKRVTNLFLNEADHLNEQQVAVFDDVLVHLVKRIESKALSELSVILAPIPNAPIDVVRHLANHDEIVVAGPVLSGSSRLTENDLVEIAKSKGQGHLLAISGRASITEAVTDVLVERGSLEVAHRLAENAGARFSELGFASIVKGADRDGSLAEKLALRVDIPIKALQQLLARATDLVRSRLLASALPDKRGQIQKVLTTIADEVSREAAAPRDFRASESLVHQLNRNAKLNERVLESFAKDRKHEEMVSTIALFCGAPVGLIERLMTNIQSDGLIVACKCAKLSWATTREILRVRFSHHVASDQELDEAKTSFLALSQATAQRAFRFMLVEEKTKEAV